MTKNRDVEQLKADLNVMAQALRTILVAASRLVVLGARTREQRKRLADAINNADIILRKYDEGSPL